MLRLSLLLAVTLPLAGCVSDVGCVFVGVVVEIEGLAQAGPHRIEVDTDENDLVLSCDDVSEECRADGDPYSAVLQGELAAGVRYLVIEENSRQGRAPEQVDVVIESLADEVEYAASFMPQPTATHGCEAALVHWQLTE